MAAQERTPEVVKQFLRNSEKFSEWALGGVDEALFRFSTAVLDVRKRPVEDYDQDELNRLERELVNPELTKLFPRPPLPDLELTPDKFPLTAFASVAFRNQHRFYHVRYPSVIKTGYDNNDIVRGVYIERADDVPAPAVLYLHGWMEFDTGFALNLPLIWLASLGYNILALHLPFHFERAPRGTYSGELSLTGNLPLTFQTLRQAVSDARQGLHWLQERHGAVGVVGKSLGSLTSSLVLIADDAPQAAVLAVPVANSHRALWHSSYTRLIRRTLGEQGFTEENTQALLTAMLPARFEPQLARERILIIKAKSDKVCFPEDTDQLVERWQTPVLEVPTGHLTATFSPLTRRATQEHLTKFLG
jgi:hypothetical protein